MDRKCLLFMVGGFLVGSIWGWNYIALTPGFSSIPGTIPNTTGKWWG
jgi:hypothetical protein